MDLTNIIEYIVYGIFTIATWFIKLLWNQGKKVEEEVEKLKLNLAENYTKKDDFKSFANEVKQDLKDAIHPLYEKITKIDDYLREKKD